MKNKRPNKGFTKREVERMSKTYKTVESFGNEAYREQAADMITEIQQYHLEQAKLNLKDDTVISN